MKARELKPPKFSVSFLHALAKFSKSYSNTERPLFNICTNCLDARGVRVIAHYSDLKAMGCCDRCGNIRDVYDTELLGLYLGFKITAEEITKAGLPVLRRSIATRPPLAEGYVLSLVDGYILERGRTRG